MPNGKKRKSTATLERPRRGMPRKAVKESRMAMVKEMGGGEYFVRVNIPATPKIQLPVNGYVPPGVDLLVYVITNRPDLRYKLELTDLTPPVAVVYTYDIPAPGSKLFGAVFDGYLLVAEKDYQIRVWVDPADGATPPHSDDVVYITTKAEFSVPISQDPN